MVFALLISAIMWNVGTWYLGLPASSSHTLIGSIMGVGLANSLITPGHVFGEGVNWGKTQEVFTSLLVSPIVGFVCSALLLLLAKLLIKKQELYVPAAPDKAPPWWIRSLLVLTCTGVSFSHGSNDGQKGMGLIMLILIGTVPTAYALNHAVTPQQSQDFIAVSQQAAGVLDHYVSPNAVIGDARDEVTDYIRTKTLHSEYRAGHAPTDRRYRQ